VAACGADNDGVYRWYLAPFSVRSRRHVGSEIARQWQCQQLGPAGLQIGLALQLALPLPGNLHPFPQPIIAPVAGTTKTGIQAISFGACRLFEVS